MRRSTTSGRCLDVVSSVSVLHPAIGPTVVGRCADTAGDLMTPDATPTDRTRKGFRMACADLEPHSMFCT